VCNFGFQSKKVEGFVEKLGKLPGFEVEKRKHLILSKLSIMAANTQVQQEIQAKSRSLVSFELSKRGFTMVFSGQVLYTVSFFLRLAIGFYMLIFQPPVNFCSDKNIQTIFGIKLKDFLNYRIDSNLISQTVEKVVKKIFLGRRNNSTSSARQSRAIVGSTST
jgi:hypothetical protein